MSRVSQLGHDLYAGKVSYDFVGRRRRWYAVSAAILLLALGGLLLRGFNLGVEFRGGSEYKVPSTATCTVEEARAATEANDAGGEAIVTELGSGALRVQTEALDTERTNAVQRALGAACGVSAEDIQVQVVGPTWGAEITKKALQGLVVFLLLVALFLSVYFEWRMAVSALVALLHDLVITVGIYALVGFEVTPATVIGVLTILGYSLYDTVVVFDKVRENTRGIAGQSRVTYSEAANLALNQTLVRSINTTVVALLPVAGILFVGAGLLGAGTLKDLALALFIGMLAGAYSSIFVATPLLAQLKEMQPEMQALARRVAQRRSAEPAPARAAAAVRRSRAGSGAPGRALETGGDASGDLGADAEEEAVAQAAPGGGPAGGGGKGPGGARPAAPTVRITSAGGGAAAAGTQAPSGQGSSGQGGGRAQPRRQPKSKRGGPGRR